ncbi:hypothetical protein AHF37_06664 [Paragonimus kellicotti]|nr:hypothetical protein AHF37_06664 [Paragonimus kellicotti]
MPLRIRSMVYRTSGRRVHLELFRSSHFKHIEPPTARSSQPGGPDSLSELSACSSDIGELKHAVDATSTPRSVKLKTTAAVVYVRCAKPATATEKKRVRKAWFPLLSSFTSFKGFLGGYSPAGNKHGQVLKLFRDKCSGSAQ